MSLTNDGTNAMTGSSAPRSPRPSMAPQPEAVTLDEQVAAMTVDDVLDAIKAGEIEAQAAVEAERRGRQRSGILTLGDFAGE